MSLYIHNFVENVLYLFYIAYIISLKCERQQAAEEV